jgi:exopolysaccharide production protein ExoZ
MFTAMVLSSIQALRFIAALLVLFFHLGLLASGYKGVDLFFVISGFVLYYQHHGFSLRAQRAGRDFFVHRVTKIFFLYWTALLILYVLTPIPLSASLIATVFLLPGHVSVLGVSWSLSYELYFYAAMGLTIFCIPARWRRRLFITALFCTTIVLLCNAFFVPLKGTVLFFLCGPNCWEFLSGILACRLFIRIKPAALERPYLIFSLLLLVLLTMTRLDYLSPYTHLFYGPIAFFLVLTITLAERKGSRIRKGSPTGRFKKWIIQLGNASYAIYLFGPIISYPIREGSLLPRIIAVFATIALALLIHLLYEAPLLRILRRLLSSKTAPAGQQKATPDGMASSN